MAGGGQRGLGAVGEAAIVAVCIFGAGWLLGTCGTGVGSTSARDAFEDDCEQAFYGQTDETAILDDLRCKEHTVVVEQQTRAEQQTKLAQAQQDLQQAQETP
jgi:hypothetical protein